MSSNSAGNVVNLSSRREEMSGYGLTGSEYALPQEGIASGESRRETGRQRELISRLTAVCEAARDPGWDGDDARPIAYLTYYNGIRLAEILPEGVPTPDIVPDDDGYVEFEWYDGGKSFSFYVTPSDVVLYAGYFGRSDRFSGRFSLEKRPAKIPKRLEEQIQEVYR